MERRNRTRERKTRVCENARVYQIDVRSTTRYLFLQIHVFGNAQYASVLVHFLSNLEHDWYLSLSSHCCCCGC